MRSGLGAQPAAASSAAAISVSLSGLGSSVAGVTSERPAEEPAFPRDTRDGLPGEAPLTCRHQGSGAVSHQRVGFAQKARPIDAEHVADQQPGIDRGVLDAGRLEHAPEFGPGLGGRGLRPDGDPAAQDALSSLISASSLA